MIRLPLLPLPKTREGWYILLIVLLCALLARSGNRITQLEARPSIVDTKIDARSEDVRRGPVKISRTTTTAPDGTKTTTSTREIASEERHAASKTETSHVEIPPAARARTRYLGVGVDPLRYAAFPRLRAGLTLWSVLDVGMAYDSRFAPTSGAFGIEAAYRF